MANIKVYTNKQTDRQMDDQMVGGGGLCRAGARGA